jgi:hypothetical protein
VSDLERVQRREAIAATALAGLLANPGGPIQYRPDTGWGLTNCTEEHVARLATYMADELIAALDEPTEGER